jgi:hypothetical protein
MALPWQSRKAGWPEPAADPAEGRSAPWPLPVVLALAAAGVISPLMPFGGAVLAYALADQDQATLLMGAGVVHVILALTLMAGV